MKIICAYNNFKPSEEEVCKEPPQLYFRPDISLLKDGKPFYLPDYIDELYGGIEIAVKLDKLGKSIPERFAYRYYHEVTVGIGFFAKNLYENFRKRSYPLDLSWSFESSAVIGNFISLKDKDIEMDSLDFKLSVNGKVVQSGNTAYARNRIDTILSYASGFFTLKIGDLLYAGTPAERIRLKIGDHLEGFLEGGKLLEFDIK